MRSLWGTLLIYYIMRQRERILNQRHSPFARMGFADDAYQPFGWVGDTMGMGMDKVSTRTVISFARCHHEGGTPQINKRKIT